MKFGKIIGRVVSTVKVESLEGAKLVLIQPLDEKMENVGDAIVAVDTIAADVGQFIYYETSKEASRVFEHTMNPADAAVMGIIDDILIESKK